jgi:hypothetical protein
MGEKGNGALRRGSMEMADAENAMDFWADRIATCFNEPCAGKLIGCFQNDSRK